MSPEIIEDVESDCRCKVLLKALETYNIEKGSFSTHYTWLMRSHVAYRKRYYTQRKNMYISSIQLNQCGFFQDSSGDTDSAIENRFNPVYHRRTFEIHKQNILSGLSTSI